MRKAIRHPITHMLRTQHAQATHRHRGTGGTVGVKVADDDNMLLLGDRLFQQLHGGIKPG